MAQPAEIQPHGALPERFTAAEAARLVVRSVGVDAVAMCAKAVRPDPSDASIPSVAAVCLYPQLVPVAVRQLNGTGVKVASVAGGFPAGLGPLEAPLREIADVVG